MTTILYVGYSNVLVNQDLAHLLMIFSNCSCSFNSLIQGQNIYKARSNAEAHLSMNTLTPVDKSPTFTD